MDASAVEIERLELRTQATPAAVPGIRRAVVDFAEVHGVGIGPDVALADSEAITNAVCTPTATSAGPVRVVACAEPDRLVVVVRDYGCGMSPNPNSPRARARARRDRAAGHGAQHRASRRGRRDAAAHVLRERLIVATALVAVAGCGAGTKRHAAADPPATPSCPQAGRTDVDGGDLHVPAGARPERRR